MEMHDIFGRCTGAPRKDYGLLDRENRVLALGDWAHAVTNDLPRDTAFEKFLAFAIQAWLNSREKTNLCRDHLKVSAIPGSTQCEQKVWQRLNQLSSRGQQLVDTSPTMEPSTNQEDGSNE